jgi:MoaA/NifB/PqqE/SkfB family radical SAM enzyme
MKTKTLSMIAKNLVNSVPLNLGLEVKPKYLWLETTDKCNSRCTTCNIWSKQPTPSNKLYSIKDLLHFLSSELMSDIKYILNSGGESTLINMEEYLRIEHAVLPKAILQISSNALLPERLATIVEYAMKLGVAHLDVGLSIDGIGEAHDKVRGVPGNFKKLEQSISLLKGLQCKYPDRIFLSMGSTLTSVTAKEAEKLYAYSKQTDIPFMWHWFNTSSFYDNNSLSTKEDNEVKKVINNYSAHNLYMDTWRKSLATGLIPKFNCHALQTFLAVKCNGDVIPCLSKWSEPIGNIRLQPFKTIWDSPQRSIERCKIKDCVGCLNSWGWAWSVNETYYPILTDLLIRKLK